MKLNEINKQKWFVSSKLKVTTNSLQHLSKDEQETIISIQGDNLTISSSEQPFINKLSKSSRFKVNSLVISSDLNNKGYVLVVEGSSDKGIITLRKTAKKTVILTAEQKQAFVDKMIQSRS